MKLFPLLSNTFYVGVLSFLVGACSPSANLRPSSNADKISDLQEAAVDDISGVKVIAQADAWPGPEPIKQQVIPVRIQINNNGKEDLRFRYSELALVAPNGERYMAIPPYSVDGKVNESMYVNSTTVVPAFGYTNFSVTPMYGNIYGSTFNTYNRPYYYDYGYYDTYGGYWINDSVRLPTEKMLSLAIPEGVIEPGGMVNGYVYFEQLPSTLNMVTFRADLVNAKTGKEFGEIRIPFKYNYVSQN